MRAPRTLFTGNKNAEIIGPPNDHAAQRAVLRRALHLLATAAEPGVFEELAPRA